MKYKLPELIRLIRKERLASTDTRSCPTVRHDQPLASIVPLFRQHERLLVQDADGQVLGVLEKNDVLEAILDSYLYLEAYFETILETMDASISVIDEQGIIAVWTKGAEQIFSLKAQDVIGKPITQFFPEEMVQALKTLKTGEKFYRKQHQPREDLFVLINTSPIRLQDRIIGSVAAETDVTSQVRLNQELYNATRKVHRLEQEVAKLSPAKDPFAPIKGTSLAVKQIKDLIRKVGPTNVPVLFLGESGVGKELFARATHEIGKKKDAPFIAINCGAITPTLFESELFGYEKGAFSGADHKGKKGMIELARGGTLFLDEIGEMPLDMQVKLLRVLQEKKFYPVGGTRQIEADFRVIAATNKDLEAMVREGKFREDLYYRLNVVTIKIPPLRERIEDIIELTHYFLYEFSLQYNRPIHGVSQNVMQQLLQYPWSGNIRELRNTMERLVVLSTNGIINEEDLPVSLQPRQKSFAAKPAEQRLPLQDELEQVERQVILHALEQEGGNKLAAARRLGISRATLYNKMNRLQIPFS